MENQELIEILIRTAQDKKAEDIKIMDVSKISTVTDFFIICTANSIPQMKAIADEVKDNFKAKNNVKYIHMDGDVLSKWIVVDFVSVIFHIFHKDLRAVYDLEHLWGDAKFLPIPRIVE